MTSFGGGADHVCDGGAEDLPGPDGCNGDEGGVKRRAWRPVHCCPAVEREVQHRCKQAGLKDLEREASQVPSQTSQLVHPSR